MSNPASTPPNLEAAVTELSLAIGRLVRLQRAEANPGELTWSQTATLARLDETGWATTADLEQEGLVQRRPHPIDGRQVLFALTDEGLEARRMRSIANVFPRLGKTGTTQEIIEPQARAA